MLASWVTHVSSASSWGLQAPASASCAGHRFWQSTTSSQLVGSSTLQNCSHSVAPPAPVEAAMDDETPETGPTVTTDGFTFPVEPAPPAPPPPVLELPASTTTLPPHARP